MEKRVHLHSGAVGYCPDFYSACFYHNFNLERHLGACFPGELFVWLFSAPGLEGEQLMIVNFPVQLQLEGTYLLFKPFSFLLWQETVRWGFSHGAGSVLAAVFQAVLC